MIRPRNALLVLMLSVLHALLYLHGGMVGAVAVTFLIYLFCGTVWQRSPEETNDRPTDWGTLLGEKFGVFPSGVRALEAFPERPTDGYVEPTADGFRLEIGSAHHGVSPTSETASRAAFTLFFGFLLVAGADSGGINPLLIPLAAAVGVAASSPSLLVGAVVQETMRRARSGTEAVLCGRVLTVGRQRVTLGLAGQTLVVNGQQLTVTNAEGSLSIRGNASNLLELSEAIQTVNIESSAELPKELQALRRSHHEG